LKDKYPPYLQTYYKENKMYVEDQLQLPLKQIEDALMYLQIYQSQMSEEPIPLPKNLSHLSELQWIALEMLFSQLKEERELSSLH
jgi:hypothetical protein